jgi:glycosyltransferase involved in cell wall biosynthesis
MIRSARMLKENIDFLFVVDKKNSPLWRAAISRNKKFRTAVLAATDYSSVYSLAKRIVSVNPRLVIVSWRTAFEQLVSSNHSRRILLDSDICIYLLVPDFIGIHEASKTEQRLINAADGFLVTSEILRDAYRDNYEIDSVGLLHDLPDVEEISRIRESNLGVETKKVLWVGNSKWGERLGFKDHKGLNKLANPVFELLKSQDQDLKIMVIDSAQSKIKNSKVLQEMQTASCLLVTSDSEGTGLPILEAAALGTPVVSVNVGIATELLKGELGKQIVDRNPKIIAARVMESIKDREALSRLFVREWEVYRKRVEYDLEHLLEQKSAGGTWRISKIEFQLGPHFIWFLRSLRN